ncbi:hypothetical protein [Priestia filamentosa]|uniref:hypothetical protein n=1 Tax=Priestia filamentosa TaxID=1402861 RepID=UPI000A08356F|nr:hypothetical protein [Priestia filamentosa]OXS67233.1 hypothetical protein B1B01_17225 [Priestia filamentosa]SMF53514.1 hypothetical protein SAMN06296056_104237 [Priestia filamentosa]
MSESFTQEQVNEAIENAKNEWIEQELNPIATERDDLLQYKPKELSEAEKAFQQQQAEFNQQKISFAIEKAGLTEFAEFLQVDDLEKLEDKINSFNDLLTNVKNQVKVELGYKPADHRKDDEYSVFEQNKDVRGMIGTKFAKLFK